MKPIEQMTDDELRSYLSGSAASKKPEDMTDEELKSYLSGKPTDSSQPQEKILNESADIPWYQRAAVKNFGGSTEEQVNYLQQKNPNLEVSQLDGEIVAKKRGEKNWKKLDPTGITSPGEAVQDLLDVGYDFGSGALSSLATAQAGILGGSASLGIGAIPSAMVAGTAASAGLEGIRQKIGQALGTAKETNWKDIRTSGLIGGIAAPLFGTGAAKGQIESALSKPDVIGQILKSSQLGAVAKGAAPTGLKTSIAKDVLEQSQKGLFGRGTDKVLSMISGAAPSKTITEAKTELKKPLINFMSKVVDIDPAEKYTAQEMSQALMKQDKLVGFGDAAANEIQSKMKSVADELSAKYTNALEKTNATFNVTELGDDLLKEIDLLQNSKSKELQSLGETAKGIYEDFFAGSSATGEPLILGPAETQRLLGSMKKFIKVSESPIALDKRSSNQKLLGKFVGDATKKLDDQFYEALNQNAKGEDLKSLYREHKQFFRELYPKFEDSESAVRTIFGINNKNKSVIRNTIKEFDQKYMKDAPVKIMDLANLADVAKYFGDPSLEAISSGGATSTGKILSAGELLGTAGWLAAQASGITGLTPAGGFVGRTLGQMAARPSTVANVLKAQTGTRRLLEKAGVPQVKQGIDLMREQLPQALQPVLSRQGLFQSAVNAGVPQTTLNSVWQLMGGQ